MCLTLCNSMDCSTPGYPVLHYLPEFAQTHVHWVSDVIQPSYPLSSPPPSALNFPSFRVFSNELALRIFTQIKWCESRSVMSDSLWPHGLYSPWNSPGQNTGVGSLSLLQGIFPTQGLNLCLPHCRQILYPYSAKILKLRCIGQDTYTLKFGNKWFKGMIYENTLLAWEYSWRSLNASAWMLTENSIMY